MKDRITLRFLAAPTDAGADGRTVQAGRVLEWIDKAGYACAVSWSASYCVTAYVGNVHFTRPIAPGELIEARARIIHTGRSSMQVLVTVLAADARDGSFTAATDCLLVFVAVDDAGASRAVPPWSPRDDDDQLLSRGAVQRIDARRAIHEEMQAQDYTEAGTGPRSLFRFLAAPSDVNWGGNAHGGIVMRWIDEAAFACATSWAGRAAVAVYSGGIHFYSPVHIGDLVEVEARLIHTGVHSMHLSVRVRAGSLIDGERRLTTQCMTVFVIPGADGRAAPVPAMRLESDEDRRLDAHARDLIARRAQLLAIPVPG